MESVKKEYTVLLSKKSEKFLRNLPQPYYSAIKKAVYALADEPRPFGYTKLTGEDSYRIRVGDYRIIYNIFDDIVTVEVININHRREVYKRK